MKIKIANSFWAYFSRQHFYKNYLFLKNCYLISKWRAKLLNFVVFTCCWYIQVFEIVNDKRVIKISKLTKFSENAKLFHFYLYLWFILLILI